MTITAPAGTDLGDAQDKARVVLAQIATPAKEE